MLRIAAFLLWLSAALLPSSAPAQILEQGGTLTEQLLPESFKFDATATAAKYGLFDWKTTISYTVTNNSGMNLHMGILLGSVSIGTCTEARESRGGMALLPGPNAIAYAIDMSVGAPRPVFVPAGQRVAGTIIVEECQAPNPGSAKAPVSMTLMLGKTPSIKNMSQVSLSGDFPVKQVRPE